MLFGDFVTDFVRDQTMSDLLWWKVRLLSIELKDELYSKFGIAGFFISSMDIGLYVNVHETLESLWIFIDENLSDSVFWKNVYIVP